MLIDKRLDEMRSSAWYDVIKTLDDHVEGWILNGSTARKAAINTIEKLANASKVKQDVKPEPVVTHHFTRVYSDGCIGSHYFTSVGDAMKANGVIQVIKHTYVNGFFKCVEVVQVKE
jgi:hypothetical protein